MKFYILLLSLFLIIITSCAKIEDNITTTSRSLLFRTNKVGIVQISSDGISWESNDLEKNSIDLYAATKSLYLQNRDKKINNSSDSDDDDWGNLDN